MELTQYVVFRDSDWRVHVFNLITLHEIEATHPHFPEGLIQLNNSLSYSEDRRRSLKNIFPFDGKLFNTDVIVVLTGRKLMVVARTEMKQKEKQLGRHIGLVGFI